MVHMDHEDIVRWRTYVGLPRLSPHVTKAAKRIANDPANSKDLFEIKQQLTNKTQSPFQVKYNQRPTKNRPYSSIHVAKAPETKLHHIKPKRVCSAPPGMNGYTVYQQAKEKTRPQQKSIGLAHQIQEWANTASNYDKEVVFNMLKKIQPNCDVPATPNFDDYSRNAVDPFSRYKPPLTAERKTHSSPVKSMAGLFPTSYQKPLRDQRVYRLMGQDHRIRVSPHEERQINSYMDEKMRNATIPTPNPHQNHIVPICSNLVKKGLKSQDYQVD